MARTIELSFDNRREGFVLPINPKTLELSDPNLNQKLTLLNMGEINLIGNRGLITCSLSSFFPSTRSPFYKRANRKPMEYIALLKKWKESKKPIRFIISDTDINLAMAIEKLSYSTNEGDADVYYTLELAEYRFLNVPTVKVQTVIQHNGLKKRPNAKTNGRTYTVKRGDCLWGIAQAMYGNGNKYPTIYNANRSVIDPRNQKYSMPKYTIYPGQVFTIP